MIARVRTTPLRQWRSDPIHFIESVLYDPETKRPFVLLPAERAFLSFAFRLDDTGRLLYREWLYSCPKKSGKTTFQALVILTMTLLFGGAFPESYILANSLEQGKGRVFEICCRIVKTSPLLKDEAVITADTVSFPAFNAVTKAIPCSAGTVAGTNAVIAGFDELWAVSDESGRRTFEEMSPPPTRKIACRFTVTYAGFEGESVLLEELYRRGMQLPEVGTDLRAGDGMLFFWSHKPVAPWQDSAWLRDMRNQRASVYQRHVLNQFASSSSQFVDLNKWDACVRPDLAPVHAELFTEAFVGIDASYKHDAAAIVVVAFDRNTQMVRLLTHRVFQPSPEMPLDFELTIEAYLLDLSRRFQLRVCRYDPYQMVSTAQRLVKAGHCDGRVSAIQSQPDRRIAELVRPDSKCGAGGLSRCRHEAGDQPCGGGRNAKGLANRQDRGSHKIDLIVALGMAAHAACVRRPSRTSTKATHG